MKISRSSWHYRITDKVFDWPATNLCLYFWQVVWSLVALPAFGIMVCGVCLLALTVLLFPFYAWATPLGFVDYMLLSFLSLGLNGAILISFWISYRNDFRWGDLDTTSVWNKNLLSESAPKPRKVKEPNIALEFLKAKHRQVCPHLDFTSEES
jgi:hypothetical protein